MSQPQAQLLAATNSKKKTPTAPRGALDTSKKTLYTVIINYVPLGTKRLVNLRNISHYVSADEQRASQNSRGANPVLLIVAPKHR